MGDAARYALVTGSASGLGRALSLALARQGWTVCLADVAAEGNAETARLVEQAGGTPRIEPLDVTDAAAWAELRERLRRDWPRLDLAVNNAGVAASGEVGTLPLEVWDRLIDVNLRGVIHGCHTLVPWLKSSGPGTRLLNVASAAGFASLPAMGAYNATKAAIISLSETLYVELRPHGVHVSVACPTFFPTALLDRAVMCRLDERNYAQRAMRRAPLDADGVARALLAGLDRLRLYLLVPARAWGFWWLKRALPEWFCWAVARQYARGIPKRGAD